MAIKPLSYKQINPEQVIVNNLVCGANTPLYSHFSDSECSICILPILFDRSYEYHIIFNIDGMESSIYVNSELFKTVQIGTSVLSDIIYTLPDDLLIGCIQHSLSNILDDVQKLVNKNIQIKAVKRFDALEALPLGVEISFITDNANVSGLLSINAETKEWIKMIVPLVSDNEDSIACQLKLELGYTNVPHNDLLKLAVGDVLFFDYCYYENKTNLFVRLSNRHGFLATVDSTRIILEQSMENSMSYDLEDSDDLDEELDDLLDGIDDDPEELSQDVASDDYEESYSPPPEPQGGGVEHQDINSIPVRLVFDVGHQESTVGEVKQLQPGYTFELNRDITSPVTVNANGKPFAECELVQINNLLGARIVRIL